MEESQIAFYPSKGKLIFGIIFSFLFIPLGVSVLYIAYTDGNISMIALGLFLTILFGTFFIANIMKIIRGHPFIIIRDESIQLNPYTKSEAIIPYTDIANIKVTEASFQKLTEIILYDENNY